MKFLIRLTRPQPILASGSVVWLDDDRVGVVDCIRQSPIVGPDGKPEQIDRAYVVGMKGEFAAWVVLNEIAHVYGVAESAAIAAALTA